MVRTGRRAEALLALLRDSGFLPAPVRPPPRLVDLRPRIVEEMLGLYRRLGGLQDQPVLRPGSWDLSFAGDLVIELDEELHFNRYRAATLDTSWSSGLPWTRDYTKFCKEQEPRCLAAG